jgi:hypothetical protein
MNANNTHSMFNIQEREKWAKISSHFGQSYIQRFCDDPIVESVVTVNNVAVTDRSPTVDKIC